MGENERQFYGTENNGYVGNKKVSDLTDQEYEDLLNQGAFGMPMNTAVASSEARRGAPTRVQMGLNFNTTRNRYSMLPKFGDQGFNRAVQLAKTNESNHNSLVRSIRLFGDNPEQYKYNSGRSAQMTKNLAIAGASLPYLTIAAGGAASAAGAGASLLNPYVAKALPSSAKMLARGAWDFLAQPYFMYEGGKNFLSEDGGLKTIGLTGNLYKGKDLEQKILNGIKSGAGDLLNLGLVYGGAKNIVSSLPRYEALYNVAKDVTQYNSFSPSNYKYLLDNRFASDIISDPQLVVKERLNGNYPLTYGERAAWVKTFKDDIMKGSNFVKNTTIKETPLNLQRYKAMEIISPDGSPIKVPDYSRPSLPDVQDVSRFGTRNAINNYKINGARTNNYPLEDRYTAHATNGKTYYPFRVLPNTLHTNPYLSTENLRRHIGAHEYEHLVQKLRTIPLTYYDPHGVGNYKRYTEKHLPDELKSAASELLKTNGQEGMWHGSLSEMDSELKGWRAEYRLPQFTRMTPKQQKWVVDRANARFKLPKGSNNFYDVFRYLEEAGYKNGGKILQTKKYYLNKKSGSN